METMKLVLPLNEEMTAIRRHIHQHPELCQLRHGQGVDILPDGHGLSGLFAAEDAEHSGLKPISAISMPYSVSFSRISFVVSNSSLLSSGCWWI